MSEPVIEEKKETPHKKSNLKTYFLIGGVIAGGLMYTGDKLDMAQKADEFINNMYLRLSGLQQEMNIIYAAPPDTTEKITFNDYILNMGDL